MTRIVIPWLLLQVLTKMASKSDLNLNRREDEDTYHLVENEDNSPPGDDLESFNFGRVK